jgi:hypothetical protein
MDVGNAILWAVAFGAIAVAAALSLVLMLAAVSYWQLAIVFGLIGWAFSDLPGAFTGVIVVGAIHIIVYAQTHSRPKH